MNSTSTCLVIYKVEWKIGYSDGVFMLLLNLLMLFWLSSVFVFKLMSYRSTLGWCTVVWYCLYVLTICRQTVLVCCQLRSRISYIRLLIKVWIRNNLYYQLLKLSLITVPSFLLIFVRKFNQSTHYTTWLAIVIISL